MIYFYSTIITILLMLLETSLLPYFQIFGAVPFLFLAFLALLSVRYQGVFHIVIAFLAGIYFDAISSGFPGVFTITFLSVAMIGRTFFYKDTGYNSTQSYYILLITSSCILYLTQGINLLLMNSLIWSDFFITTLTGLVLTTVSGFFVSRIFDRYIDWLNKKSEERFR